MVTQSLTVYNLGVYFEPSRTALFVGFERAITAPLKSATNPVKGLDYS